MPNARGRGSDPEQTRRRLIDAADHVFAERGFEAASVDEICRVAGFTRGAFYANYTSKDELFLALMESDDALHAEGATVSGTDPTTDLHVEIADRIDPDARRRRDLVRIEFILYAARRPELWPRLLATSTKRRALIEAQLEQLGSRYGFELPLPAEDLARVMLALNTGLAMADFFEPARRQHRTRLTDAMLQVLARAASAAPSASAPAERSKAPRRTR